MSRKPKPDPGSLAYLKLLNLVDSIRRSQPALDPLEERLLNRMAVAWHKGEKVTVTQAMEGGDGVAPATVHRRLKQLRAKGLVALVADANDTRVRFIEPTDEALRYFGALDDCLRRLDRA
jgi:DNA-binding transcriptional ArsR family regulator